MALWIYGSNIELLIFKLISSIDILKISYEIALNRTRLDIADDQWALVQLIAWCRQATSHNPNQCSSSLMTLYGVTRVKLINILGGYNIKHNFYSFQNYAGKLSALVSMMWFNTLKESMVCMLHVSLLSISLVNLTTSLNSLSIFFIIIYCQQRQR